MSDLDLKFFNIILNLDRCIHGRHHQDRCFDCQDGQSTGNLFLHPGQRIGTTIYGDSIVVPEWSDRWNAGKWIWKQYE